MILSALRTGVNDQGINILRSVPFENKDLWELSAEEILERIKEIKVRIRQNKMYEQYAASREQAQRFSAELNLDPDYRRLKSQLSYYLSLLQTKIRLPDLLKDYCGLRNKFKGLLSTEVKNFKLCQNPKAKLPWADITKEHFLRNEWVFRFQCHPFHLGIPEQSKEALTQSMKCNLPGEKAFDFKGDLVSAVEYIDSVIGSQLLNVNVLNAQLRECQKYFL